MAQEVKIKEKKQRINNCSIAPGELNAFLFANQEKELPEKVMLKIRDQSIDILCKCVKPTYKEIGKISETGLVIGYVQSGKTLSFTSVISLAADNGYRIIIVLAGRNDILLKQTDDRLRTDLGIKKNGRKYSFFTNPGLEKKNDLLTQINNLRKPAIIITILKHQKYLNEISQLLTSGEISKIIAKLGVLIIDDEADQASLNTKALKNSNKETWEKNESSAIYDGIISLKKSLNYHSYIQYTATPQANLLIDFLDILSPTWHEVLDPGEAYTGGKTFFRDQMTACIKPPFFKNHFKLGELANSHTIYDNKKDEKLLGCPNLIRAIPTNEIYHPTENPLPSAPESFKECLRSFLINSTIITELKLTELEMNFTSMIIHMHSYTSSSNKAKGWLNYMLPQWAKDYNNGSKILKDQFLSTFIEEEKVLKSGFIFEDVYEKLNFVLTNYKIHMVLGGTEEIVWEGPQAHILIGGIKLDRGFTVKNLTHTYMPRYSVSASQGDTIQQRCRFFGYKKDIIQNCRVYLPPDSICEYADYVTDEEDLREYLKKNSLEDFFNQKHTLSLSPRLRPTRGNILSSSLVSKFLSGPKYFNPLSPSIYNSNLILKDTFIKSISKYKKKIGINYGKGEGSEKKTHDVYLVPLKHFEKSFFNTFQLDSPLEELFRKKIIRYIDYLIEVGKTKCFIINMSQGATRLRAIKVRSIKNKKGTELVYTIGNPFSGKDPNNKPPKWPDEKDLINNDKYKEIYNYDDELIIQFHKIKANCKENKSIDGKELITIAIYFPPKLAKSYIGLKIK